MSLLLQFLLNLFKNSIDLPTLLVDLAAKLLEGVEDSSGCKERLLQLIRSRTLDDEFGTNPLGVICCILHVILSIAEQQGVHVHESFGFTASDPWMNELAFALGIQPESQGMYATADGAKKGLLVDLVLQQLLAMLFDLVKDPEFQKKILDFINNLLKRN